MEGTTSSCQTSQKRHGTFYKVVRVFYHYGDNCYRVKYGGRELPMKNSNIFVQ